MTPTDLRAQLQAHSAVLTKLHPRAGLLERTVAAAGSPCWAQPLPPRYPTMVPKQCFVNAARLVGRFRTLTYVEGYAYREGLFPMHHAWAVDADRSVVDPTWRDPELCAYWGVPFDRDNWQRWSNRPQSWSLFDSARGLNLPLIAALS
jgi:hypothetical protein